ncbi:hypothetical protein CAC42_2106 [Sphaceloma murrayae]|uniref:Uncharacterized protein n=1 Tax=Sphaceloma murrayae TaxID=2082308 RepID=A0A2K1QIB3_9PEZI|nr:hypothetical protein CAC42_2106 [Sphaceloma murrayae]
MPINTTGLRALCWSILYGVDKIPDNWFDKIPYYQSEEAKKAKKHAKRAKKDAGRRRNASADARYDGDRKDSDRRRRRSYDDEDTYSEDDDDDDSKVPQRRGTVDEHRRGGGRHGDDGAANANYNYAQPRAHRVSEFPVNPVNLTRQPYPNNYQNAGIPSGIPAGAAHQTASSYDRPNLSGPVPAQGYVPYGDIYHGSSTQATYPRNDQFNVSHSALPRSGAPGQPRPRGPSVDEPRGYEGRRRDSRYESDSHDSEGLRGHRRRRDHSRDRAQSVGGSGDR